MKTLKLFALISVLSPAVSAAPSKSTSCEHTMCYAGLATLGVCTLAYFVSGVYRAYYGENAWSKRAFNFFVGDVVRA